MFGSCAAWRLVCVWIGEFGRRGRRDGLPPCGAIHPPFFGFVEIFRGGWINRRLIRHCGVWVVRGLVLVCVWFGVYGRRGRLDGLPPCGAIHPPSFGFVEISREGWINRRLIRHCSVLAVRGLAFDSRLDRRIWATGAQ